MPEGRVSKVKLPPFVACETSDLLGWMDRSRRAHGDIFSTTLYGSNVYVVTSPAYADHVLRRNYQNYRKGLAIKRVEILLGRGLMASEGALWKTQRRMIQPAFQHKTLARFLDSIDAATARLQKRWTDAAQRQQNVNVTQDVSHVILEIVLRTIFGPDYDQIAEPFSLVSDDTGRDLRFAEKFRALGGLIIDLKAHRREGEDDFLGMLMAARDRDSGEPMSDAQLVNEVLTLIVAGHETTAGTLAWVWYLLSQHPEADERLAAEVSVAPDVMAVEDLGRFDYARRVIEETMRLYPAGWLITRRALGDDEIGGCAVRRGTEIYIPIYLIQRHPELWTDPDGFDPDRFLASEANGAMLAFSAGPRNCIGEHLARMEMLVHLVKIRKHLALRHQPRAPLELDLGVNLRSRNAFIMQPQLVDKI